MLIPNTETGKKLLLWYRDNARDLPWRETKDPYKIWISEVVLQQTQVKQGLQHYLNFVEKFPTVFHLAEAPADEVLLAWKGLGYYSRALNLHFAAKQIVDDFGGEFPNSFHELLKLKGVGKYTAAAMASICFNEKIPAVDGNFYRVFSRFFGDGFDVSSANAFVHFSNLALKIMPENSTGDFNQAVMDLGSEICRPRNPNCEICPFNKDCAAFQTGRTYEFPVKTKKVKVEELSLQYFFVENGGDFLAKQRDENFIWKKLYEFPTEIPESWQPFFIKSEIFKHKLTHRNLIIKIDYFKINKRTEFEKFAAENSFLIMNNKSSESKSFPKPLTDYIAKTDLH